MNLVTVWSSENDLFKKRLSSFFFPSHNTHICVIQLATPGSCAALTAATPITNIECEECVENNGVGVITTYSGGQACLVTGANTCEMGEVCTVPPGKIFQMSSTFFL